MKHIVILLAALLVSACQVNVVVMPHGSVEAGNRYTDVGTTEVFPVEEHSNAY